MRKWLITFIWNRDLGIQTVEVIVESEWDDSVTAMTKAKEELIRYGLGIEYKSAHGRHID